MRRHIFALIITSLPIGSTALAIDEITLAPSKLEQEQAAFKEQDEAGPGIFLVLMLVAALAVPVVVVSLLMLGKKEASPPGKQVERAARPKPRTKTAEKQSGADRPRLAAKLQGLTAPKAAAEQIPGLKPGEHPPFFLVRATYRAKRDRMARIYVLADELLVIDAGPGSDFNEAAGVTAAALSGGGLVGSMIGSAIGSMIADDQQAHGQALQQKLDRLNLEGLLEWVKEDGNFRAPFDQIVGVSIDAGGRSYRRDGARTLGTFRFRYLKRGEYTFEFLCPAEVRGSIELLRRSMSSGVHVGSGWDEVTARYLEGV